MVEMDPDAIDGLLDATRGSGDSSTMGTTALRVPREGEDERYRHDFSSCTNPEVPDGAVQIYQSAFATARRLPEDVYCEYRVAAAEFVGCDPEQVIPTPGGTAALRLALATAVDSGDEVLVGTPAPRLYEREVTLQGATPRFVESGSLFDTDPADYALALAGWPNPLSGEAYDPRALSAFADRCREASTPLVLDESALPFTDLVSMAGRDGVVVTHELGKVFGFPGLRAGFAVATESLRDRMDVARLPCSLGSAAAELAVYCMDQTAFLETTRERVRTELDRMRERLDSTATVSQSVAPYLLLDTGTASRADRLIQTCEDDDIAVYDARSAHGLDSHVRVAVKQPNQNDTLLESLS